MNSSKWLSSLGAVFVVVGSGLLHVFGGDASSFVTLGVTGAGVVMSLIAGFSRSK